MNEAARRAWYRLMGRFILFFLFGTLLHYLARPQIGPIVNRLLNAKVATFLINAISPGEAVSLLGSSISSSNASLQVAQGCEGLDVALMIAAAVVAFPLSARKKVLGILAGTAIIYACNLARIIGLWYCFRFFPSAFDTMHTIVGQTVIILVGVVFVGFWTGALRSNLGSEARIVASS